MSRHLRLSIAQPFSLPSQRQTVYCRKHATNRMGECHSTALTTQANHNNAGQMLGKFNWRVTLNLFPFAQKRKIKVLKFKICKVFKVCNLISRTFLNWAFWLLYKIRFKFQPLTQIFSFLIFSAEMSQIFFCSHCISKKKLNIKIKE